MLYYTPKGNSNKVVLLKRQCNQGLQSAPIRVEISLVKKQGMSGVVKILE